MDATAPIPNDDSTAALTAPSSPMMAQYIEIKAANPDCLLFYRMGDFYEMFFDDAEVASRALGITLTKRGKHLGADIPMCGVPIHAADQYLQKLIALGHRVAVCEQIEDPAEARKRGGKSVVRRDVIRLVTPGTLTEDALLVAGRNNYLAAIAPPARRPTAPMSTPSPGSIFRPASSALPPPTRRALPPTSPASTRARCWSPTRCTPMPNWRRCGADLGAAVTPLSAAFFDGATAERPSRRLFRRAHASTASAPSRASSWRRPRRRSPTSRRRRSGSARRFRRRSPKPPATPC